MRQFFKFENPTPVQTPATIIDPTVIYPCFCLRNDRTDFCYCQNGKVTPGPVFHKFLTPGPGPNEKRRIQPESTPALRCGPICGCHWVNNRCSILSAAFAEGNIVIQWFWSMVYCFIWLSQQAEASYGHRILYLCTWCTLYSYPSRQVGNAIWNGLVFPLRWPHWRIEKHKVYLFNPASSGDVPLAEVTFWFVPASCVLAHILLVLSFHFKQ